MRITGKCHCGNISFGLEWEGERPEIPARACTCSFCVKHGGVWTSNPGSTLEVNIHDPSLDTKYRFGTMTADFHVCSRCGVVPLVTSHIEGRTYAVVNVNVFENVEPSMLRRASVTFEGEDAGARPARRKNNWIADVRFTHERKDGMDWERRLADLWASIDEHGEQAFLSKMELLVAELPADSAVALFERAGSLDSTGHSDLAVPLYRRALERGLPGQRRRRAVIQMASSLRNLGQASESVALLMAERERESDDLDDAVSATLALALVDTGREREAVSVAVTALSRHMTRYRRSMANYARLLSENPAT